MSNRERVGAWIVAGAIAVLLGGTAWAAVYLALLPLPPNAPWLVKILPYLSGFVLLGIVNVAWDFWRGRAVVRWFAVVALIVGGGGIIKTATDLPHGYPDAASPEERAALQAEELQFRPVVIGLGVVPVAAGLLLLLPHVGNFLTYRRDAANRTEESGGIA